ncbi:MAG TPA: secretion protein [Polyangia bacterium]|nr:secretion protein [Polyangia bacterium]
MRALIASLVVCAAGCGVELEHGLDERQANQVAALLETAGLPADKVADDQGGYKIVVARADVARAFTLLEAHDLPRRGQKGLAETFGDSSLLPSAVEERARYAAAMAAELERTLEAMPGVTAARVHLALPADDPLATAGAHGRPTASVLVKARGTLPASEADVRRLVAGAVATLQPADVSVVFAAAPPDDNAPPLDHFGPLRVAHGERATVAALSLSGLGLIMLLSIAVALAALRNGTLRRRLRDLEKP